MTEQVPTGKENEPVLRLDFATLCGFGTAITAIVLTATVAGTPGVPVRNVRK